MTDRAERGVDVYSFAWWTVPEGGLVCAPLQGSVCTVRTVAWQTWPDKVFEMHSIIRWTGPGSDMAQQGPGQAECVL
jgi:hypothetical protein